MSHSVRATVLAALLVLSAAVAGVGFGTAAVGADAPTPSVQEADPTENVTLDAADEVWVDGDGNLILRYQGNTTGVDEEIDPETTSEENLEYGLAVSEGLFYSLITANSTGTAPNATSEVEGQFHALLTTGQLNGSGALTAPRPDAIQSMTLGIEGVRTREDARFDGTTKIVIPNEEAGAASLLQSATVNAEATVGASSFTSSGSLDASLQTALGPPQAQSFTVTESDGSYTIDAAEDRVVSAFAVERWNTSTRAEQSLNALYANVAQSLGGSADITLESYALERNEDDSGRLEIEYTVEYTNIEEGLSQQIAFQLAQAENVNLTQAEATDIAQRVTELQVNEVSASFEQTAEGSVTGAYNVDIANYDTVVAAGLDVASAANATEVGVQTEQIEQARTQLEAQRVADLTRTYSLSTTVESGAENTTVTVDAQSRSQNWAAYVQELEDAGISYGSLTYAISGGTEDEQIALDGEFTLEQEGLVGQAISQFQQSLNASATENTDTEEVRRYLRAFEAAEFDRAKTDVTFSDGELRIEAGAKFDNLAALRDVVAVAQGDGLQVTETVGRTEGNVTNSYVYVRGAAPGDASEEDIRALSVVDANTTVHMPGTWDREFPTMDRPRARNYLGLTPTPTATPTASSGGSDGGGGDGTDQQTPDGSSGDGAGFGVGVALVALLAAALLALRRS
jgi:PGF-CTERM protein